MDIVLGIALVGVWIVIATVALIRAYGWGRAATR
jgi:hypothetical protein